MEGRRAIGDADRNEPLIRTVHGRGYRFEDVVTPEAVVASEALPVLVPVAQEPSVPARQSHGVWMVAVAGIALAILVAAWFSRRGPAIPAQRSVTRIAILPISAADDEKELQLVGMSITDLLEDRLSRVARVRVRGADYSRPLSTDAPTLAELARRAGVERVISGTVRLAGDKARLELTLHDVGTAVRDTPLGQYETRKHVTPQCSEGVGE